MTSLRSCLFAWSLIAVVAASDSQNRLPPPTGLKRKWLDPITVEISWEEPPGLPTRAHVHYEYNIKGTKKKINMTGLRIQENLFTQETDSDHWRFEVRTVSERNGLTDSLPATLDIFHDKQKAELVKDFKCLFEVNKLNCSWIPANPSLNLTVSYRICGSSKETIRSVATCGEPRRTGHPERQSCVLWSYKTEERTCVFVETDSAVSTFKPQLVIDPPLVNVTEENNRLRVTLTPSLPEKASCMKFEVCYKGCNARQECLNTTDVSVEINSYDGTCRYEIRARAMFLERCMNPPLVSDLSDPVSYGTNQIPHRALTIATIFVFIVLSICIVLLCHCVRKHRDIFWPIVPDPSVIFKQMMNGNNDLMTPGGNVYTPVPETVCPLQVQTPT